MRRAWPGLPAGLLVSVRSVAEARAAAAGGAAIIDVKDPSRGPLGRADAEVAAGVAEAAHPGAAWTIACGELAAGVEVIAAHVHRVLGLVAVAADPPLAIKAGPAGLSPAGWGVAFRRLRESTPAGVEVVAVAYADWRQAASPDPGWLIAAAAAAGARAVLVDTFDKSAGGLLATAGQEAIAGWTTACGDAGLSLALAGRLSAADIGRLGRLGPATLGVRSAACEGGRQGTVDQRKVAELVGTLAAARGVPGRHLEARS